MKEKYIKKTYLRTRDVHVLSPAAATTIAGGGAAMTAQTAGPFCACCRPFEYHGVLVVLVVMVVLFVAVNVCN
jgi:hypothetical protein